MAAAKNWLNTYMATYSYYDATGLRIIPTATMLEEGFEHYTSGIRYEVLPTDTEKGIPLLQKRVKRHDKKIADLTRERDGMLKAIELMEKNPEFEMLLDLHKKGLI